MLHLGNIMQKSLIQKTIRIILKYIVLVVVFVVLARLRFLSFFHSCAYSHSCFCESVVLFMFLFSLIMFSLSFCLPSSFF